MVRSVNQFKLGVTHTSLVHPTRYPLLGVLEHASRLSAYVAWNPQDLQSCPLHEYLRSRTAKHTLIDADGGTFNVRSTRLAGLDWQRVRAIGFPTQAVSALLSFGNVPIRIELECEKMEPIDLRKLKDALLRALAQRPSAYTVRKPESAVRTSIGRARTFSDLAAAISTVAPNSDA